MKNKINKFLLIASVLAVFTSCNDDDTLEDVRNAKPSISVDQKAVSVTEGDEITFTVSINQPLSNDIDFMVTLEGGTGSFRDFTTSGDETTIDEGGFGQGKIGYKFVFPALATTATFTVTPVKDLYVEGTETLKLNLKSSGNMLSLVAPDSQFIDVTVTDYVSNDVGVSLEWDKVTNIHGTISDMTYVGEDGDEHDTSGYDYDLYVLNGGGAPINFTGGTANNPEFTQMNATLPDGDYYVYFELYEAGATPETVFNHDLNVTISKYGVWSTTINVPSASDEVFADIVAVITKVGNTYTVTDFNSGEVLASGRHQLLLDAVKNFRKRK